MATVLRRWNSNVIHLVQVLRRNASFQSFSANTISSVSWNGNAEDLDLTPFQAPDNIRYHCHYVVPNKLMMGKSPNKDMELMRTLTEECGINTFVTLTDGPITNQMENIDYFHFPIPNFQVENDQNTVEFMSLLMRNLAVNDTKMYVHCNSGHGRAGVITSLLLQCVYGMPYESARTYLKAVHAARCSELNIPCDVPSRGTQVAQVQRLHSEMMELYRIHSNQSTL